MVGAEVGNYLRMFRGKLYKRFPGMTHRTATEDEREEIKKVLKVSGDPNHASLPASVSLLRADEVVEIMAGRGAEYKAPGIGKADAAETEVENYASLQQPVPETPSKIVQQVGKKSSLVGSAGASSGSHTAHHLDAVPMSTPCINVPKSQKRIRTFPLFHNSYIEQQAMDNANQPEELVPIRIDMELEGHKLRDCFVWNRNERLITPESFAEVLCDDLKVPPGLFVRAIADAIRAQCRHYKPCEELLQNADEARVIVKLNLVVGNILLEDQIEWDMSESENTPERFAQNYCKELGLGGEFVPTIAYAVRGQLAWHQTTASFSENPLPVISTALRNSAEAEAWCPQLDIMNDVDLTKKIRDQDRNTRRLRRVVNAW